MTEHRANLKFHPLNFTSGRAETPSDRCQRLSTGLIPEDGPIQVLHFQPEGRARAGDSPNGLCGSLCGVRIHGRCFPQGHPAEQHPDPGVGRTGEISILCPQSLGVNVGSQSGFDTMWTDRRQCPCCVNQVWDQVSRVSMT